MTSNTCTWIGEGCGCNRVSLDGKSYCEEHYDRVYMTLSADMATYIIEKELSNEETK
jgi:hypothetical protein